MWKRITEIWHCVMKERGFGRMAQWLLFSAVLYIIAFTLPESLTMQAAILKCANVNAGLFVGYWGDRSVFYRADDIIERKGEDGNAPEIIAARMLARAIIMAGCVYGFSAGIGV